MICVLQDVNTARAITGSFGSHFIRHHTKLASCHMDSRNLARDNMANSP